MTCIRPSRQSGVTLIELMVAMVLGLLVAAGIASVFISTSASSHVQTQMAELQENGRFAITEISRDLRMANGQYCTNTGGVDEQATGGLYLDHLRSPDVYAKNLLSGTGAISGALHDVTTAWGTTSGVTYPAAPTAKYSMPSFLFMRGYDCELDSCTPIDPTTAGLPAMDAKINSRVKGAGVITLRYVNPSSGWAIGAAGGSTIATNSNGNTLASIALNPLASESPASYFTAGDLAMLADCSHAQIFAVNKTGNLLAPDTSNNFSDSILNVTQPQSAPKVFDVNRDFQTVTYYLKVVSLNNNDAAPFTGALIRRINGGIVNKSNGGSEDEIVRGIERLDFAYGVQDVSGNISYMKASDIEAASKCPPAEPESITTAGCLWRGVISIEVSILMDGQTPLYTLHDNEMNYAYSVDLINTPAAPSDHPITPTAQGFTNQLLRREFIALVAVRNYNP